MQNRWDGACVHIMLGIDELSEDVHTGLLGAAVFVDGGVRVVGVWGSRRSEHGFNQFRQPHVKDQQGNTTSHHGRPLPFPHTHTHAYTHAYLQSDWKGTTGGRSSSLRAPGIFCMNQ